jgi:ATP-dependent Clp protease ATP-binding subunit ClpB
LGRLDRIVCFRSLTSDALEIIAQKYLDQLCHRLEQRGIQLILPAGSGAELARQCRPKDGARHLRRLVQQQVESPLAEFLLRTTRKITKLQAFWEDGSLQFRIG